MKGHGIVVAVWFWLLHGGAVARFRSFTVFIKKRGFFNMEGGEPRTRHWTLEMCSRFH